MRKLGLGECAQERKEEIGGFKVTAQPGKEFFSLPNLLNKGLRYANG
jgi:hypothetical protein